MNTKTIIVGVLALAVGLAGGYGFSEGKMDATMNHEMGSTMDGMTSGLHDKTGLEFEQAFIDNMIVHHEGAVAMAQMVLQKSHRPELVQLANDIVAAQTREIDMMRSWKTQWFATSSLHATY